MSSAKSANFDIWSRGTKEHKVCIERCSKLLSRLGISREILNEHRKIALAEMEGVYKTAKEAPWPNEDNAFSDVQDLGDPREGAF